MKLDLLHSLEFEFIDVQELLFFAVRQLQSPLAVNSIRLKVSSTRNHSKRDLRFIRIEQSLNRYLCWCNEALTMKPCSPLRGLLVIALMWTYCKTELGVPLP